MKEILSVGKAEPFRTVLRQSRNDAPRYDRGNFQWACGCGIEPETLLGYNSGVAFTLNRSHCGYPRCRFAAV